MSFRTKRHEHNRSKKNNWKQNYRITCHNSINLAKKAIKKADYIAFGAFFAKTKKVKYKATTKILNKIKKLPKYQ